VKLWDQDSSQEKGKKDASLFLTEYLKQYNLLWSYEIKIQDSNQVKEEKKDAQLFLTEYTKQYNLLWSYEIKFQDSNQENEKRCKIIFLTEYLKQYNLLWSYEIKIQDKEKYSRLQWNNIYCQALNSRSRKRRFNIIALTEYWNLS